ncbi:hypothetical protein [Pyrococcus sp. ST04]|uniref:hypothetical protein n=1 Tax=Pyrococcus sp. ST04 TaxID=1183377 RepID=UPI00064EBE04|nr:hypothetical protein [Pyrococcus sp. ST04]
MEFRHDSETINEALGIPEWKAKEIAMFVTKQIMLLVDGKLDSVSRIMEAIDSEYKDRAEFGYAMFLLGQGLRIVSEVKEDEVQTKTIR